MKVLGGADHRSDNVISSFQRVLCKHFARSEKHPRAVSDFSDVLLLVPCQPYCSLGVTLVPSDVP